MSPSKEKIDAIYELREAAEKKALDEKALSEEPSARNRDKLLASRLDLEHKTMTAIEVCHDCGHEHRPGEAHIHL